MAAETHAAVDTQIAQALAPLRDMPDVVADIGAGIRITTALIARTISSTEIFATNRMAQCARR